MKQLDLIKQAGPPLMLLPLFDAPWDAGGLVWWMIGLLAAVISLFTLLLAISRTEAGQPRIRWQTMLRPLLTIAMVCGAVLVGLLVQSNTERYADELASSLQRKCTEQGRCPVAPEGWKAEGKFAHATRGHWQFTYVANATGSEFGLWIDKGRDNELCIHGGRSIARSEVKSLRCRTDANVPSRMFR